MKNVNKKLKKSLLLVAMMLTAMIGSANEISSFKIGKDLKGTALTIEGVKKGNLLSIIDYNGIIVYKELIEASGTYKKGFDLTELPNGNYFFEIDKDLQIETIPFNVEENIVTFNKEKETVIFKPYLRQNKNMVYVSKLAPDLKPLKIDVYARYDGGFSLIHSEKVEGVQIVEKVYKFKRGNYKIIINSDDKEYTKFINN